MPSEFFSRVKAVSIVLLYTMLFGILPMETALGQDSPDISQLNNSYTFLSPVKDAPMSFTSLGIQWEQDIPDGTSADIHIRFLEKDLWTDWYDMHSEIDGKFAENESNQSAFIATNLTKTFQYKIILNSGLTESTPVVSNIKFTYINVKDRRMESSAGNGLLSYLVPKANAATALNVISRSSWGADESLRVYTGDRPEPQLVKLEDDFYEKFKEELKLIKTVTTNAKGEKLTWPLEYPAKVTKIIIHHTATTKNLDNPKQAIRDIYYWHAISRGWGDIGYNYIIDTKGNIYEGRSGGDSVVGAHAGKGNVGSVGISVLGNYQESEVTSPIKNALTSLIKEKSALHNINIAGSSMFRGENLPNLIGHRDVMSTACPGTNLYALLPKLRESAQGERVAIVQERRRNASDIEKYNFDLVKSPSIVTADANTKSTVEITLKNTGKNSWSSKSYIMLSNNGIYEFLKSSGLIKSLAAGKEVKPGSTITFKIPIETAHASGLADIEIFPMVDGTKKMDKFIGIPIQINPSSYDFEFVSLSLKKNALKAGERTTATLKLKNTGTVSWEKTGANPIKIGTENPRDHISKILAVPGTRLAQMVQDKVNPGETAQFIINIKAPLQDGYYEETFAPVIEGVTWLPVKGEKIMFYVGTGAITGAVADNGINFDFTSGQTRLISFQLKNTGLTPWQKTGENGMKFETVRSAGVAVTDVQLVENTVTAGQSGNISLKVKAPTVDGKYRIMITPTVGGARVSTRPIVLFITVKSTSTVAVTPANTSPIVKANTSTSGKNNIRIGLGFIGNPIISATGSFKLFENDKEKAIFLKDEKVTVTYADGKFTVKGSKSTFTMTVPPKFVPQSGAILRIDNYENHPSWKPELNDNEYRGNLEVHYYENKLVVVNELDLETYLKGLAEISASDHYEKIKAVIVLARSYAKFYMTIGEKFPGAPYHLSDDPAKSQYYIGYGFEKRNTTGVRAVTDTSGEVVTYNGKLIKTPYFSSDDGRTRSAQEVWGWKDTPYLISVDDPGCKGQEMRGHGVGLSGCGSLYFAKQGKSYKEIIKYYFQGVEVVKQ